VNYRFRYPYGVGKGEVESFVEANPCVKDFLAKYKNSVQSQFFSGRSLCMFFKWLRVKKEVEISPAGFLNVLLKKRSSVKVADRHWGRNLGLQFSRDNPDFKGLADTYVRGKYFFPLKLFCDYHEVPLTSARALFSSCNPLKYDEKPFTIQKAKEVLAVLNQRDRAICMVMLQSGQSIGQVLVDINRDAQYIFDEIDQGKQRVRLSFKERKNNHFRYFSYFSRDAIQEIVKWRSEREERLSKHGKSSKWLFIDRRCKPLTPHQFQTNFKDLMRNHGIWTGPYTVRSHMFRKMFEQEASPPDRGISKLHILFMMGHKAGKRLINKMDMVGGTYDKSPWIHKAVEQEYQRLEPYINIYSGKQVESVVQQENVELKKRLAKTEMQVADIQRDFQELKRELLEK